MFVGIVVEHDESNGCFIGINGAEPGGFRVVCLGDRVGIVGDESILALGQGATELTNVVQVFLCDFAEGDFGIGAGFVRHDVTSKNKVSKSGCDSGIYRFAEILCKEKKIGKVYFTIVIKVNLNIEI